MRRVKTIHFVGIGGAGMSGIAEVLHNLGYRVSGSDLHDNASTERLKRLGIRIHLGHRPESMAEADVLVVSSAVGADNVEVLAARESRIPVVSRAEMLAEIMRFRYGIAVAGTHGKTTTTSLIASLLARAGLDPTFVIGGRLNSVASHARLGSGKYLVAEADESDTSFLYLKPVIAVLTNIDADHLGSYRNDFSRLRGAFLEFLHHLPFYGLAVVCMDDPVIRDILGSVSRPLLTYGIDTQADLRAEVLWQERGTTRFRVTSLEGNSMDLTLNLPGVHNVLNALAAIAVARELNIADEVIKAGLERFEGIARRSQLFGEIRIGEARALLIDDYGHHPREIAATLAAVRAGWPDRRLVVAFQPHRYTRTVDLFQDFVEVLASVDTLVLFETYAAGETYVASANSRALWRAIQRRGGAEALLLGQPSELAAELPRLVSDECILLTLGAGNVGTIAPQLWRFYGAGQELAAVC
ncbi:MAG: UDP-N-acetylmuramate--L-alanine ligase [Gammaproteobacteria bacterium]